MTAAPVTVIDHIPFTASVSPEQAASYVRRKLPGWEEQRHEDVPAPCRTWIIFNGPEDPEQVLVPAHSDFSDFSLRMAELCSALVALGCVAQPSDVLRAMVAEPDASR